MLLEPGPLALILTAVHNIEGALTNLVKELVQELGRFFQIGVDQENMLPGSMLDAGHHGLVVPIVAGQLYYPQMPVGSTQAQRSVQRIAGRPIFHHDTLILVGVLLGAVQSPALYRASV